MATQNKAVEEDFHAVEFMREVREKPSAEYQADREKYLKRVRKAMAAFIARRLDVRWKEIAGLALSIVRPDL